MPGNRKQIGRAAILVLLITGLPLCSDFAAEPGAPLQAPGRGLFVLQVPEAGIEVQENQSAPIPYRYLSKVRLVVRRSPQEIPFGKINTRVNGEASNIIMRIASSGGEIRCDLDLNYRPGFLLQPGRNAIEIWAESIYGRFYYSSFLLDARDEPHTQREIRTETEVSGADRQPPIVQLVEPQGAIERAASVRIAGSVESVQENVSLRVAGREVPLQSGTGPAGSRGMRLELGKRYWFDVSVPLPANRETIEVVAEDVRNNRTRLTIPVVQRSSGDGERFAVVIGVSRHTDSRLNLRFAERDAAAMRDFFLDPKRGGVPPGNLLYLVNESATVAAVRSALNTFLQKPGPQDLVLIYFAGHGAPDVRRPQNLYLVTSETDLSNMGGSAVPMSDIQGAYERTIQGRVLTLVDACHSAGVTTGLQNLSNQSWTRLGYADGRAVITASEVNQFSLESEQWGGGHGAFTYFVLQGLDGAADANHDLQITVGELFDFVRDSVTSATDGKQTPSALAGGARGMVLVKRGSSDVGSIGQ
jgi:hypothetical protein